MHENVAVVEVDEDLYEDDVEILRHFECYFHLSTKVLQKGQNCCK